jgi:alpha-beta hydrolase superfamily lysophospholipase
MTKKDFYYPSTDGKTQIHAIRWEPEGEPKAILQIIHGMVEFIDRYDDFAKYLTEHGYLVTGEDHIGHGASVQSDEYHGYFGDEGNAWVIADIHRLREMMQKEFPGVPYLMLGHSMGSFLLRKYIVFHGDISGAIIMGSGYTKPRSSALGIQIANGFAKVYGWRHRSKMVTFLAFRKNLKYDTTGKDPARNWLSKDPESVRKYYSDPRCTYLFTLNGFKTA